MITPEETSQIAQSRTQSQEGFEDATAKTEEKTRETAEVDSEIPDGSSIEHEETKEKEGEEEEERDQAEADASGHPPLEEVSQEEPHVDEQLEIPSVEDDKKGEVPKDPSDEADDVKVQHETSSVSSSKEETVDASSSSSTPPHLHPPPPYSVAVAGKVFLDKVSVPVGWKRLLLSDSVIYYRYALFFFLGGGDCSLLSIYDFSFLARAAYNLKQWTRFAPIS